MADVASPAQAVLDALGFVLFAREESGALRLLGEPPDWLAQLWPRLQTNDRTLPITEASPFLENFLIDAAEFWKHNDCTGPSKSGPWIEQTAQGESIQLEARAMTAGGRKILLIERLGEEFETQKSVLQRARETVIAHQRLNSEIQKKEVLLHCVADEMTSALANIITSLRLIELENNGPRTKQLLGLANRATEEQQTLIHRVLGVFEEELRGVYGSSTDKSTVANWSVALRNALENTMLLFIEKNVRIESSGGVADNVTVLIDAAHLERVIVNLLEAALERSRAGDIVIVRVNEDSEALLASFEDNGAGIAPKARENIFAKFNLAGSSAPGSALRLHFCRIVIQNGGGEIGCDPLPAGGNRFWIRLTKSGAVG